ncbi:hypothetical protein Efla_000356 [Eimeria flavescens]
MAEGLRRSARGDRVWERSNCPSRGEERFLTLVSFCDRAWCYSKPQRGAAGMESFAEEYGLPSTPVYTVKDVMAQTFIQAYANHLKKRGKFVVPKWADLVKTGHGKTLAPHDADWLFVRAAAMLRHLYLRPSCGVGAFRKVFSCKTGNKCIPGHTSKASGKIIRYILQQFEAMGLVESRPDNGRRLTKVGQKELDVIARQCGVSNSA